MKRILVVATLSLIVTWFCSPVFAAPGSCDNMKIVNVGINASAPSGVAGWLVNQGTKACGPVPIGGSLNFFVSTTNTDRVLAVLLTATSMGKNVWTYLSGGSQPYILGYVTISN